MSRLKRWGKELVILLALVTVVSLAMDWLRSPQVPANWSDMSLQTLAGQTVSLKAMSQDKPLLIYFWATWCGVCKFTSPSVNQMVQEGENVMTVALRVLTTVMAFPPGTGGPTNASCSRDQPPDAPPDAPAAPKLIVPGQPQ